MQNRPVVGRRNLRMATILLLVLALGVAYTFLERRTWAQAQEAPRFEVDPLWPKPLPNHWVLGPDDRRLGRRPGRSRLDRPSQLRDARRQREGARDEEGENAARARRRCSSSISGQPAAALGRAGRQGYEWPIGNHGIFIDHKGNVWIGGNGGPDSHILKFTKDGKFLMQVGKKARAQAGAAHAQRAVAGFVGGSNDQVSFGRVAKIFVDREGQRGLHRRRLPEQARRRARCRHRQDEALLGRLRQQARRRDAAGRTTRPRRPRSSSATRCTARTCRWTASLRLRSRRRPPPGLHARRQVRQGSVVREEHEGRRARCGTSRSRRTRSRSTSTWPTVMNEKVHIIDRADAAGADDASATAGGSRASSTACTASRSTRRATSTRPRPTREAAAEVRLQGRRPCAGTAPGHAVASVGAAVEECHDEQTGIPTSHRRHRRGVAGAFAGLFGQERVEKLNVRGGAIDVHHHFVPPGRPPARARGRRKLRSTRWSSSASASRSCR